MKFKALDIIALFIIYFGFINGIASFVYITYVIMIAFALLALAAHLIIFSGRGKDLIADIAKTHEDDDVKGWPEKIYSLTVDMVIVGMLLYSGHLVLAGLYIYSTFIFTTLYSGVSEYASRQARSTANERNV